MSKKRREIPRFDHPIIETHCHLDYLKERPLEDILLQSEQLNIERIITIAVAPDNLERVRQMSQMAPWIYGTQGIHPHEAETFNDEVEAEIRTHAGDTKIVAVGTIGLDYYYDHADREVQRTVLPTLCGRKNCRSKRAAIAASDRADLPQQLAHVFSGGLRPQASQACLA